MAKAGENQLRFYLKHNSRHYLPQCRRGQYARRDTRGAISVCLLICWIELAKEVTDV